MSKAARLFKLYLCLMMVGLLALPAPLRANEVEELKKSDGSMYREVFDQNIFYEWTNYLHLERLYRAVFHKKVRSQNANVFDELADDTFYTNRHARKKLSPDELEKGFYETDGPDLSGDLTITHAKFWEAGESFLVEDIRGNEYVLKFDPYEHSGLVTSSEVIASRFYYAIGYHVPQYSMVTVELQKLVIGPNATVLDHSGFYRKLTPEKLQERFLFLPQDAEGRYRASAQKVLNGKPMGSFRFYGLGKNDPEDRVKHENRREIRTLQVFASWLSNYEVSGIETMDMLVEENGRQVIKHYLTDFHSCFGAVSEGAKPPMFAHEYLFDFGDTLKAFFSFGLWKKPWQKRWQDAGEQIHPSPAIGYFDNRYFNPERFKTQLPHYAFKDLTRADGFWAAKVIMSFSDEDVAAMVKAGQLTDSKDEAYLAEIVAKRRDLIGRYWFQSANSLDRFQLEGSVLTFEDLAVKYSFQDPKDTVYLVDIFRPEGKKRERIASFQTDQPSVDLKSLLSDSENLLVAIRTKQQLEPKENPSVFIKLNRNEIISIEHED